MHEAKAHNPRRATPEKLKRDAKNIKEYARFVIVLKESGEIEVIDNGVRRAQGLPYARIIAVLGPVQYGGESLSEGNLLEIGYSRTRPYASTELSKNGGRSHRRGRCLKQRPRIRLLSDEEMARVYPHIIERMLTIILESCEHWKTRTWHVKKRPGYTKGPGEVGRGIYFTVSHSDRHLHRQFSLEDVRHRKDTYILRHISWVRWLFKKYKFSRQLRKHARARQIADMLSQGHYTAFYRTVLCRHFGVGSRERVLLDSIVEQFNIEVSLTEQEAHVLELASVPLPQFVNLRCYRPLEQPTIHARGATVFELFLEKEHRLSLERSQHEQQADEVPF